MRGFTLIEMLTVVAIIAVLAAVSIGAYRKYSDSGRAAEAMAMIGEFRTKEAAYYTEYNQYLSTGVADAALTDLYPVVGGSCAEPCSKQLAAKPWTTAPLSNWQTLGVAPTRNALYCGYVVAAGTPASWGFASANGKTSTQLPTNAPGVPWFYVHAVCDNNAIKSTNTEYIAPFNQTSVVTTNEHN
jgi:prepilin-type N-terminal cleavage/methylation domain-containing protein